MDRGHRTMAIVRKGGKHVTIPLASRTGEHSISTSMNAMLAESICWLLVHPVRGTIVAMTTDSLRNVKDRFSEFVDRVESQHERIVVTRNGRPAVVLISPDDLDSLEETLDLLGDQVAIRELVEAQAAVASGDVVRGVDAVRSLRPTTRR